MEVCRSSSKLLKLLYATVKIPWKDLRVVCGAPSWEKKDLKVFNEEKFRVSRKVLARMRHRKTFKRSLIRLTLSASSTSISKQNNRQSPRKEENFQELP